MSTFTVPRGIAAAVLPLAETVGLRPPTSNTGLPNDTDRVLTWTPDLTANELTLYQRLVAVVKSAVLITPAEWEAIEADIAGLTTYNGIATPTLAQTAAATKAQNRILRALLRD